MKKLKLTREPGTVHWVGDGFPVRSVFSYDALGGELDPFLLLDYAEPYFFEPGSGKRGVGAHPHRGFETVTLALQGEIAHRDSTGGGGLIGPGDVQWMTAGAGLLHEEFHSKAFVERGGLFQMAQLWVNLPAKSKSAPPGYQAIAGDDIPEVSLPDEAGQVRVIAGRFADVTGPAKTFTPINLWHFHLKKGKSITFPVPDGHTSALFVMGGQVITDQTTLGPTILGVYERKGTEIELSVPEDSQILFLGGEPIGEPLIGRGPFVMNSEEEIATALRDYQTGKMGEMR